MDVRILVAAHKAYRMPNDPMYLPLHVGKAGKTLDLGFAGDDTGETISDRNASFCELTGLYWAWKNLSADYVGLSHYRRYFTPNPARDKWASIMTTAQAEALLDASPILVPTRRRYYIESVYSQYAHSHHTAGLDLLCQTVQKQGGAYPAACDTVMHRTWLHLFNMFVMRRDLFDRYCTFLFDVLFQVEAQLDISDYDPVETRVFGYLGERLLDIWLEANALPYREVPVTFMEPQNWVKKGGNFLVRKFFGKREA